MQVTENKLSDTKIKLTIIADKEILDKVKNNTLNRLKSEVKIAGFRAGKAPLSLVEKQIDSAKLQSEFLDNAIQDMYIDVARQKNLRPVEQPKISVIKFVPFNVLEFSAEVEIIGEITLPDYKKISVSKKPVTVTAKDVDEVIEQLLTREAERKIVTRAAKEGDEATIDFSGTDQKTKKPIPNTDGKNYPLILGSNTFIPGFETHLVGMKPGDTKDFDIKFPADYQVQSLQKRMVVFKVTLNQVREMVKPKLTDLFASKIGNFKNISELKEDVKKQLVLERDYQANRDLDNELVSKIVNQSKVLMPDSVIEERRQQVEQEERQNLLRRGQTWEEHLKLEGISEEEHLASNRKTAAEQVKTSLVIGEISQLEGITVTSEELKVRIKLLKDQYNDPQLLAELDKPERQRDIEARLIVEKTLDKLRTYATAQN